MDPNETVQIFLNQDPFHKVKRKPDKKKKNVEHRDVDPQRHSEGMGQGKKIETFSDRNSRRLNYPRNALPGMAGLHQKGFQFDEPHFDVKMNDPPTESNLDVEQETDPVGQMKKKKKRAFSFKTKIQVLPNHPEKTPPLVGYFPSGFDPHRNADEGTNHGDNSARVRVYRNKIKQNRMQLVVSPANSKVDFVGTNYLGEATAGKQHCTYALGVLDKETQSLKIVPIASNMIFRLEPKVGGSNISDMEQEKTVNPGLSSQQKVEKLRELTSLFGTKKSIKQAQKLHSLKQEDDLESQTTLNEKIKNVVVNKEALEGIDAHTSRNIPPYNGSATTPQEAYPIDKIILKGEWAFLEDIYKLWNMGAEIGSDAYPSFVCNRIYKLQDMQDEEEKKRLSCIFSYITHLVKFRDQHSIDGVSSAKGHQLPSILKLKFTTMFADPQSKFLSSEKSNLLVSYVLVLTLFVDSFLSDPSHIAKDLRTSPLTLRVHYENLGCKFTRQNSVSLAMLPIPLQFQELRQKRRRR